MNALIKLLYALLVAGALIVFVGFGIYSFYQPPKMPKYPSYDYSRYDSATYKRQQNVYNHAMDRYDADTKKYQEHVTYMLLPIALVSAVAGLYLMRRRRAEVIGEGLALGGAGISIYAIIMASFADARVLRFIAVSLLLAVTLLLAYFRFSPQPRGNRKSQSPSIYGD